MARSVAETGTLIFAIVNLITVVGSCLTGLGLLICLFTGDLHSGHDMWGILSGAIILIAILVLLITSLVSLLFSSFLMNGIIKKKPQHLKVYFVFGVVQCFLTPFAFMYMFTWSEDRMTNIYMFIGITFYYIIYPPILYMIRYTYKEFETNYRELDNIDLVEKS